MDKSTRVSTRTSMLQHFWEDLQPTPGRLSRSLRAMLAAILLLILMLVLQMPFLAYGLVGIFLIGRENPLVSLRSGIVTVLALTLVIATEMSVVILSDNDPMARVLSISVVTFLAGMIVVGTSLPPLGSSWGLFYCVMIGFWERHVPQDKTVKNSLFLAAAFALAAACSIAVEYIFGSQSPAELLEEEIRVRYAALDAMFRLYAEDADADARDRAAALVARLAAAGQARMVALYNQIVDRNMDTGLLAVGTRVRLTMQAELMDDAAAFGLQGEVHDDAEFRQRCARIAEECRNLIPTATPQSRQYADAMPAMPVSLLDRVETDLHAILVMPTGLGREKRKELAALPARKVPFFIPGAIRDPENLIFAIKLSFCATACYIAYNAIDWPGISTSVTTVMVTGLSTTAATKQRLTFRTFGWLVGGLILGLGSIVFLFPYMDSITSLIVLVAPIAFASAWVGGSPRFGYVGLQLMVSFSLVAIVDAHASTELAPARDRLIGILVAIAIMWLVFDQIRPVRTVTAMRRVLASVLQGGANFFISIDSETAQDDLPRITDSLRDRLGKNIAALRSMNDTVEYEFGVDREKFSETGAIIIQIAVTAAALIWNQVAHLHGEEAQELRRQSPLVEMRRTLAEQLNAMAAGIVRKSPVSLIPLVDQLRVIPLVGEQHAEYVRNTIARYEDLRTLASILDTKL
jgi:multidrug resistance protein MdtO